MVHPRRGVRLKRTSGTARDEEVGLMTAAILVAVIFFLLATLPPWPARVNGGLDPERACAVRFAGAYHIHSVRSDGAATRTAIAAAASRAGLAFVILTDHGDGTASPDPPAYLARRAVHRRGRNQHERRTLRRARTAAVTVPARRRARRRSSKMCGGWEASASPPIRIPASPSSPGPTGTRPSTASSG